MFKKLRSYKKNKSYKKKFDKNKFINSDIYFVSIELIKNNTEKQLNELIKNNKVKSVMELSSLIIKDNEEKKKWSNMNKKLLSQYIDFLNNEIIKHIIFNKNNHNNSSDEEFILLSDSDFDF